MPLLAASHTGMNRLRKKYPFLLSKTAFWIGVLTIVAGVSQMSNSAIESAPPPVQDPMALLIAGAVIVLSALAYKSAKNRKLGTLKNSTGRKFYEISLLMAMLPIIALQNNIVFLLINDPFTNLFLPAWGITAYSFVIDRQYWIRRGRDGR